MSKSKIHIKKENRGKFNATKKRTGKSTEELTHSKDPLTRKRAIFAQNAAKWHHALGGYYPGDYYTDYGFGSWLGRNVGNIAQVVGGALLTAGTFGAGAPAGIALMASGVGGAVKDAAEQKKLKEIDATNDANSIKALATNRMNNILPTLAAGGHMPEGVATFKDAKEFLKLYPTEMALGEKTEYEHTGNKKLAQRIAADHIKDHLKMTGGDPSYYTRLKASGISDELNKMMFGGPLNRDRSLIASRVDELEDMNEDMKKGGYLSPEKARKMLKDGKAHGKPLTEKQRKYFGLIASGKKATGGYVPYALGGEIGSYVFGQGTPSMGTTGGTNYNRNILTEYKGGGTHEQNSYGGIPVGNKARVEEGEFRFDDPDDGSSYIFSNRY